jgi:predicted acyltransferase (DUF342 family)
VSRDRSISSGERNPEEENLIVREIVVAPVFIQQNFNAHHFISLRAQLPRIRFLFSRIRERRAKRGKSAWSTYLERLNIYKQWPDGSLADWNGSDTLLPWFALI